MDDTSLRELSELRALLAAYGPAQVFGLLATLWTEAATLDGADEANIELWECAAEAARQAATSLTAEGEELAEDEDGEWLEEDPDEATGDDEEAHAPDAPAAPHEQAGEAISAAHEDAPASAPVAAMTAHETDEETIMAKDSRLGPRPANASAWRCKRKEGTSRRGTPLLWEANGVGVEEWPIRSCSADTILERWGPGIYIVQYMAEEGGKRRPCGTSRVLHISGRKDDEATNAPEAEASRIVRMPAAMPLHAAMVPHPGTPSPLGGDPMIANVFALMTYMNEQSERSRLAYETRAKREEELKLERDRIAMEERIALAQLDLQAKLKLGRSEPMRGRGRGSRDDLVETINSVLNARRQHEDEDEDDEEGENEAPAPVGVQAAPTPLDSTAKIVDAVKDTVAPLIAMLATYLQQQGEKPKRRGEDVDDAAE